MTKFKYPIKSQVQMSNFRNFDFELDLTFEL